MKRIFAAATVAAIAFAGTVGIAPAAQATGECYFGDYITMSFSEYDTIKVGSKWNKAKKVDAWVLNDRKVDDYKVKTFIGDGCSFVATASVRGGRVIAKSFEGIPAPE